MLPNSIKIQMGQKKFKNFPQNLTIFFQKRNIVTKYSYIIII